MSPVLLIGVGEQKPGLSVQQPGQVQSPVEVADLASATCAFPVSTPGEWGDCLQGAHLCGEGKGAGGVSSLLWGPAWGGISSSSWPVGAQEPSQGMGPPVLAASWATVV